jgi:PTH1 family peptidyl-tRNA hydrolase
VFLIVGLGNPGSRYANTRHNVGFMVADRLVPSVSEYRSKFSGEYAQFDLSGERVAVLKPLTFMNESGRSVRAALQFFKLAPASVLVVHDELDLPFEQMRLKLGGGDAGHNGLKSITAHLGTSEYVRLRLGIGRPGPQFAGSGADYVLQAFPSADLPALERVVDRAVEEVKLTVARGLSVAMNATNQKPKS